MKAKLVKDIRGFWLIRIDHSNERKSFSLGTKSSSRARNLFDGFNKEVETYLQEIGSLVEIKILSPENSCRTEADIERAVYNNLWELGLKPLGRQVRLRRKGGKIGCIIDILALEKFSNKKIAIEVKKIICESHLGQCLRYLDLPDIEMVYLIGESVDNSIHVFDDFNIRIFLLDNDAETSGTIFKPYLMLPIKDLDE